MQRGYRSNRAALLLALILMFSLGVGGFILLTTGIARVTGETGNIATVTLTNGLSRQQLWRLPNGVFIAIINLEGEFEIVCKNGERVRMGYVTPMFSTHLVTKDNRGCVRVTRVQ